MARGTTYGDMLREARMRRGMDLHSVARRLRLRADILASIEDADFASLPPSGYTRNMITSYARLVGLDPREVSARYLDELHLFETGSARISPDSTRYSDRYGRPSRISQGVRQRSPMVRRTPGANESRYGASYDPYDQPEPDYEGPSYGARTGYSRSGYSSSARSSRYGGSMSPAAGRGDYGRGQRTRGGREVLRAYDSYAFPPADVRAERGMNQSRSLPAADYATSPYAGLYSRRDHGQKAGVLDTLGNVVSALVQRLPLVIGVVAAIVVLIVVVSFIGGGDAPAPDETPTMPISGLTDTSDQNSDAYNMAATEPAPTSAKFAFKVAGGSRSWMQIEVDGHEEVNEVVHGPESEEYEFTNSVEFRCGNISPVTITVDGKEVKPTYSEKSQEYVYNVTFSSILSEWQRAHPGSTTGGASSGSSSASSSSGSSSSSSSSSSNR